MARIRTIKPEFPQSESMGRVSRDARLLFVLIWTLCDDHGNTRAASRMLASLLFPYDEDAVGLIDTWIDELVREQCIDLYEVEGSRYLHVRKWLIHQKIDKPGGAKFPEFVESSRIVSNGIEDSRETRERSSGDQGPRTKDQGPRKGPRTKPKAPEVEVSNPESASLPAWLPRTSWQAFLEMRQRLRKPATQHAQALLLSKLDALRVGGHDPQRVIDQSIERSWQSFFPLRDERPATASSSMAGIFDLSSPSGT